MRRRTAAAAAAAAALLLAIGGRDATAGERDDLAFVLDRALYPVQVLAYCWREVAADAEVRAAGLAWDARNGPMLDELEARGRAAGLDADERNARDAVTLAGIAATVAAAADPAAHCRAVARLAAEGRFDLDRRADLEAPLRRLYGGGGPDR